MSNDNRGQRDAHLGPFGSPLRPERDDPGYQTDRLRQLCAFSLRLVDAYQRRLRREEREGRAVWKTVEPLGATIAEQERALTEARAWISELEHAKSWLEEQRQKWERACVKKDEVMQEMRQAYEEREQVVHDLQRACRDQERRTQEMMERGRALRERVAACQRRLVYRVLRRLGLLDDLSG